MENQEIIMVVHGVHKAVYDFTSTGGQKYDNLEVFVTKSFSEQNIQNGCAGQKVDTYKIKDSSNFILYKDWKFPLQAKMIFQWDFSGKKPVAILTKIEKVNENKI